MAMATVTDIQHHKARMKTRPLKKSCTKIEPFLTSVEAQVHIYSAPRKRIKSTPTTSVYKTRRARNAVTLQKSYIEMVATSKHQTSGCSPVRLLQSLAYTHTHVQSSLL